MSLNLNYGYVKPTSGDESASVFFDILSNNWVRISDHVHDGNDSSLITSSSISKYSVSLDSQLVSCTGLNYTANDTIIDLLIAGATAGMYVFCEEALYETYITGVTGTSVTLSAGVTGSNANGTIELSNWNNSESSVFERTITLPSGYPSSTSFFKFYVNNALDEYYNHEIFPTIVYDATNLVTVKVNENSYDLKMVVL